MTLDYRKLFESVPSLFLILSPELEILAVTDAYVKATLTKRENIIGKHLFEVFPDNPDEVGATGVNNLSASLKRALQFKVPDIMPIQKYDVQRPASEGGGYEEKYWSPINTPILGENREVLYIIHRVEDVTDYVKLKQKDKERHKLAEELKDKAAQMESEVYLRAQQLEEANQQLKEAEWRKSDFVSNISHELRTPLTVITSSLSLANEYFALNNGEKQKKHMDKAFSSAIHMSDIIKNVFSINNLEAGKTVATPESFSLPELADEIVKELMMLKKGQEIRHTHTGKNIVFLDMKILKSIIINLLSNAIKFTRENKPVELHTEVGKEVIITVKDQGIGIDEADQKRLFERFFRSTNAANIQGTGLGLNIVSKYVELMQGNISFQSKLNEGTSFTVRFPLKVPVNRQPSL